MNCFSIKTLREKKGFLTPFIDEKKQKDGIIYMSLLVSYRKHQQKKAQLLCVPSSDLSTCQTLLLTYFG